MIRFEIKRNAVKIFKTEYVPLAKDSKGKVEKGTGESVENVIETFKRNELEIPENLQKKLTKTEYAMLEKALMKAHEDDIREEVNKIFNDSIDTLFDQEKHLHLIDFDQELFDKIEKILRIIKRKARSALKEKNEVSD
jgi:hypothetical protein